MFHAASFQTFPVHPIHVPNLPILGRRVSQSYPPTLAGGYWTSELLLLALPSILTPCRKAPSAMKLNKPAA